MVIDNIMKNGEHKWYITNSLRIHTQTLQIMYLHEELQVLLSLHCKVLFIETDVELPIIHLFHLLPVHDLVLNLLEPEQAVPDIDGFDVGFGEDSDEVDDGGGEISVVSEVHFYHTFALSVLDYFMHKEGCVPA